MTGTDLALSTLDDDEQVVAQTLFMQAVRSPVHMEIPEGIEWPEWYALARLVVEFHMQSKWWAADLIAAGERKFGERALDVTKFLNLEPQTVSNMISTARRVPPNRRVYEISFEHHTEVAVLEPTQQKALLKKAQKEDWTRSQIRDARRQLREDPALTPADVAPAAHGICPECGAPTVEVVNPDGETITKYARP